LPKRRLLSIIVAAVMSITVIACAAYQNGSHVKHVRFYSESLHKTMNLDVYLPPNYSPYIKYPVLYLLHGKDGNENSWMTSFFWFDSIHIDRVATKLIAERRIRPLIIVSPEIDNGYGINTSSTTYTVGGYSRGQYANFITQDLVHYINSHYSVIMSRDGRYIGGYSMGGFAALHAAFTNQQLYSKVGVISAALWDNGLPASLSWLYPTRADQESRDPITIAKRTKIKIPVLIIEGESDPFYSANLTLAHVLETQSAPVTLRIYPGQHNFAFWRSHATELLLFFAQYK
jgi:enterochelin esterase-like enzyme